ncbi:Salicylate carboxymethyltransferase [Bienertia sinuspersici]
MLQKQVLSLTKPIKEKALRKFYGRKQPTTICIADLGCSSAEQNTLNLIFEFTDVIEKARKKLGKGIQEYQVYLNDLPANDFNTIFRSLGNFETMLKQKRKDDGFGHCFIRASSTMNPKKIIHHFSLQPSLLHLIITTHFQFIS